MKDQDKTREQLITENEEFRRQIAVLQETEARVRCLLETVPLGVAECDTEGMTLVNPAYVSMTGYSSKELVGMRVAELIEDGPQKEALLGYFKHLVCEQPTPSPYRCKDITKDGRLIDVQVDWAYKRNPQGQVTGFISVITDITERKYAEEELAKSKAILQAAIECLPFDFFAIGADGYYLMENAACRANWGRLVGKAPEEMAPKDEVRALWLENNRRAFAGEKVEDLVTVTVRGEERIVYQVITPIRDGTHSYGILGVNVDITERKRAEEALRKAHDELEERIKERTAELAIFQKFAEASGRGFGMADLDGLITYVNPMMCRMLGEDGPQDVIGMHHSAYCPEQYRQQVEQEILPTVLAQGQWSGESAILTRQGSLIPTLENAFLMFDDAGQPFRLALAVADLTEQKQAQEALRASEEALRQSERRFRSYFEQGLIGMAVSSVEKRWTQVNDRLCDMLGYSRDELQAMKWTDLTHPDDLDRNLVRQNRLLAGEIEHYTIEKRFLRKDGSIMYATVFARCFRRQDGSADHFLALIEDITERKRTQEALAASEEKYRLLVETTGTGYLILDGQGRIIDANAEYVRISGHRTLEEILGRTVVEWTAPYDVDRNAKEVEKCYRRGFVRQLEIDYVHPDGKIIPIDINATCLDTEDGRRIVCLCRDITERRETQEALERERQSLWRMLQASDHERQIISYDIHDGLAQYLAAAGMQFQVFDHLRESNPEEAKKAYDAAVQLVSQSHFESRRLISEVRPPVIDEIGLETAISHLVHEQRRGGGPKIEFRSEVQFGRLPAILENSLYRIAQEALTNASKHSKSKKVKVTMTQEGQEVRLEVQDWGIGFDPESVEKGHFGLEGIRQRARLLGCRLKIESTPGSGTLVQVVVPIVERKDEG